MTIINFLEYDLITTKALTEADYEAYNLVCAFHWLSSVYPKVLTYVPMKIVRSNIFK